MVAHAFGVSVDGDSAVANARRAIDAVVRLSIQVGTAQSISQMGGGEEHISTAVEQALTDPCMLSTPVPASRTDIAEIYARALENQELYPPEMAVTPARSRL